MNLPGSPYGLTTATTALTTPSIVCGSASTVGLRPSAVRALLVSGGFADDTVGATGYFSGMSFNEVLLELPALTVEQRQLLIRRALEVDDAPFSPAHESLVESRLTALRDAPASAVSLEEMKRRLRTRSGQ